MLNKIVFAFGSKTVHDLKDNMKKYIDLLIGENVQFVIGDCDGGVIVFRR